MWCLDSQIRHKLDYLKQHVLLPGRPPVVVLAHSIGAYMALHALRHMEEEEEPGSLGPNCPKVVKVCGADLAGRPVST